MELGRIVLVVDGDHALFIRRKWLTKIFVCGDVFSFMMQGAGKYCLPSGNLPKLTLARGWSTRNKLPDDGNEPHSGRSCVTGHHLWGVRHHRCYLPLASSQDAHGQQWEIPMAETHAQPLHCQHPHLRPIHRSSGRVRARLRRLHPLNRVVPLRLRRHPHVLRNGDHELDPPKRNRGPRSRAWSHGPQGLLLPRGQQFVPEHADAEPTLGMKREEDTGRGGVVFETSRVISWESVAYTAAALQARRSEGRNV